MYLWLYIFILLNCLCAPLLLGSDEQIQTVLEENPFVSARASGMSEAISTVADGVDSSYYNPAGIGGVQSNPTKNWVRELYFPYVGAGTNKNTQNLVHDFNEEGGSRSRALGEAVLNANAGKRQYGRFSSLVDVIINRVALVEIFDYQFVAMKRETPPEGEKSIVAKYLSRTGPGLGFSFTTKEERLYFGVFSSYLYHTEFYRTFEYEEVSNLTDRQNYIFEHSESHPLLSSNAGMLWVLGKNARPSLALVAKGINAKDEKTIFTSNSDLSNASSIKDLTLGFSISPAIANTVFLNLVTEAHHLTSDNLEMHKKLRVGFEANSNPSAKRSLLSLRGGYNSSGASYGARLNFGLIEFEGASYVQDIGLGNEHVLERRYIAVLSVNAAD